MRELAVAAAATVAAEVVVVWSFGFQVVVPVDVRELVGAVDWLCC